MEEKLILLRKQKKDILVNISTEEDHIKAVEEELYEEREQLKSERASFQERKDKLSVQQVSSNVPLFIRRHHEFL